MPIRESDLTRVHNVKSDCTKGCGKNMMQLPVKSHPRSSEFYCADCHDSIKMDVEVATYLLSGA